MKPALATSDAPANKPKRAPQPQQVQAGNGCRWLIWGGLGVVTVMGYVLDWRPTLIYRHALQDQWWRWITAHFTHFDIDHLTLNLVGTALIVWAFGAIVSCRVYLWSMTLSLLAVDLSLWYHNADYYAGFSGVFYGVLAAAVLCLATRPEPRLKKTGQLLLGLLVLRMLVEVGSLNPITHAFSIFHPAHTWGCLGGVIGWLMAHRKHNGAM
ncbi:rhomboid family intramembrane serine protease [Parvibium lacunae]|uniref:Rhomboid family intramembrane serine protease n=1 Tax=Parvibium lacunae TaxID=1888893 RepID=A0A368L418_9BURK|nr:rhomboid family intramembrane serine protease [Parvibium lacunae]RCS58336.1 rhomboid family intramembrane serine protease [Parvibium lacunae]